MWTPSLNPAGRRGLGGVRQADRRLFPPLARLYRAAAMQSERDVSDYDHLSRFGEWDMTKGARHDVDPPALMQIDAAHPARNTWLSRERRVRKTSVLTNRVARLLLQG